MPQTPIRLDVLKQKVAALNWDELSALYLNRNSDQAWGQFEARVVDAGNGQVWQSDPARGIHVQAFIRIERCV